MYQHSASHLQRDFPFAFAICPCLRHKAQEISLRQAGVDSFYGFVNWFKV